MPPGFERILDERYCMFFGPNRLFTNVYPFDLDDVEAVLAETRAAARDRGVTAVDWWIGPDTKPDDLGGRLSALGLRPADIADHQPHVTAMTLLHEPPAVPGIVARAVATLDELRAATEAAAIAFDSPKERLERALADAPEQWEVREGRFIRTFGAWLGGRAIGSARSVYADRAVHLVSGAVLPAARGRGVYRALLRARWDDAVERGTPILLVHAGEMSRPVLERVGFETLLEIDILLDLL